MPKTTRGRRPAPNPKKHLHRQLPRTAPLEEAGVPPMASATAVAATAPAARPAASAARSTAPGTSLRRMPNAAPRRRFIDSVADYAYVAEDLRRISMVAGSLLVLLVALSFIIR